MVIINKRFFLVTIGFFLSLVGCTQTVKTGRIPDEAVSTAADVNEPALPFVPGSWTLVILPDTQTYCSQFPGLFDLQTQWIVDNKEKYNITYVLQNGDITDYNTTLEWQRADRALRRLDDVVPYVIVTGNHDYGSKENMAKDRTTNINKYFPPSRFENWPTFGGVKTDGRIENNYHLFEAGGKKWLILGLEWGPRDETLQWANQILRKFPQRHAIIVTHAYLYSDSTLYDWQEKGNKQNWNPHSYGTKGGVNDGRQIWDKLVRGNSNVFMVINGHVLNDGLGFFTSTADNGNKVYQMLVNFQMRPLGGESWLRLLEFLPDGKTIQVKTYCPLYEKYETGPESQFIIKYSL
jgi:3',5'-cyclic AMP phosphodiesterase CpdA